MSSAPQGLAVCLLSSHAVPSLQHSTISPLANRVPISLPTAHKCACPGRHSSRPLTTPGSEAGGEVVYIPSDPATHPDTAHTHTHTHGSSTIGDPIASCPCPIPLDIVADPDTRIQGISSSFISHKTLNRHTTELVYTVTQNTGHPHSVPDTTHNDTQYHPGGTPEPPPHIHGHAQSSMLTHNHAFLGIPTHSTQDPDTILDILTHQDHTQLQNMARGLPQLAAHGHAMAHITTHLMQPWAHTPVGTELC